MAPAGSKPAMAARHITTVSRKLPSLRSPRLSRRQVLSLQLLPRTLVLLRPSLLRLLLFPRARIVVLPSHLCGDVTLTAIPSAMLVVSGRSPFVTSVFLLSTHSQFCNAFLHGKSKIHGTVDTWTGHTLSSSSYSPSPTVLTSYTGLYYKLHGKHRPSGMKKQEIKRRKRIMPANPDGPTAPASDVSDHHDPSHAQQLPPSPYADDRTLPLPHRPSTNSQQQAASTHPIPADFTNYQPPSDPNIDPSLTDPRPESTPKFKPLNGEEIRDREKAELLKQIQEKEDAMYKQQAELAAMKAKLEGF